MLGDFLRNHREAQGLGLRALATQIDVSPTLVSRIESGATSHCSEDVLSRWAEALGLDVDYVLALGGRIRPDVVQQIASNPLEWAAILRSLRGANREKLVRVAQEAAREVKDGEW